MNDSRWLKDKAVGYVCVCLTMILWGSVYISNSIALKYITAYELALFRFLLSVVFLFVLLKIRGISLKIEKKALKHIFVIGILSYFLNIECTLLGVTYAGATMSSLLISLCPVSIMIFAAIILKERLTLKKIICISVALIGVVIVSGGNISGSSFAGVLFCMGAVVCFGLGSVYIKKYTKEYEPMVIVFWAMLSSLLFFVPVAALSYFQTGPIIFSCELIGCVVYSAVVGTAVAQSLWNMALSKLEASTCSMFYPLQPIASAILGIVLLHEQITVRFMIGSVLIMSSIVGCFIKIPKR